MVRKYTDAELLQRVEALESFNGFPTDFWILGVRSKADLPTNTTTNFIYTRVKNFIWLRPGQQTPD